jgi:hypothetical protein
MTCPQCNAPCRESAKFCGVCGSPITPDSLAPVMARSEPQAEPPSLVKICPDGEISVSARTLPEAKLALKELKLRRKEVSLAKRQVMEQKREMRAAYTEGVRQRGSKIQGLGKIGRFVRQAQTISRDAKRRELAQRLSPLETRQAQLEGIILALDQLIVKIEGVIAAHS